MIGICFDSSDSWSVAVVYCFETLYFTILLPLELIFKVVFFAKIQLYLRNDASHISENLSDVKIISAADTSPQPTRENVIIHQVNNNESTPCLRFIDLICPWLTI